MLTSRKNNQVKALQTLLANEKKHSEISLYEYTLACSNRPDRYGKDGTQESLCDTYDMYGDNSNGCSKAVHFTIKKSGSLYGEIFEHIVVKRMKKHCISFLGNQVHGEIDAWQKYCNDPVISDALCPILAWHKTRSDKVTDMTDKGLYGAVIIAQKARKTGTLSSMCRLAEKYNNEDGFYGTDAGTRETFLRMVADECNWSDVKQNGDNCGVIFDYYNQCWKAVIIDYAL